MDYQLFLLAAIKERRDATGDAQLAVREGIARTGRPITNAAAIMIVVFIAFGVTGPIPPTELGLTLALAVLLDATVIRMMLMPSLLGLLGERRLVDPEVARPAHAPRPLLPLRKAHPHRRAGWLNTHSGARDQRTPDDHHDPTHPGPGSQRATPAGHSNASCSPWPEP